MLKNLKIGISFLQALLISDTSYDLEKLDEEEAGETDDQSEEGDDDMEEDDEDSEEEGEYQFIFFKCETVATQFSSQHFHEIF